MKAAWFSARLVLLASAMAMANCSLAQDPESPAAPAPTAPPIEDQGKVLASLVGTRWRLENLCGNPVVEGSQATLGFPAINKVSGRASVNHFAGAIGIEKARLKIGPLMMTEMAGPPAFMTQEQAFLDALANASSLSVKDMTLTIKVDGKPKPLRLVRIPGD